MAGQVPTAPGEDEAVWLHGPVATVVPEGHDAPFRSSCHELSDGLPSRHFGHGSNLGGISLQHTSQSPEGVRPGRIPEAYEVGCKVKGSQLIGGEVRQISLVVTRSDPVSVDGWIGSGNRLHGQGQTHGPQFLLVALKRTPETLVIVRVGTLGKPVAQLPSAERPLGSQQRRYQVEHPLQLLHSRSLDLAMAALRVSR